MADAELATRAAEEDPLVGGWRRLLLSASGMCTAVTMLLSLVPAGGHIVTTTDCYRRTRQFIQAFLPKMGITSTVLDPSDYDGLQKPWTNTIVRCTFQSPTNPYLKVRRYRQNRRCATRKDAWCALMALLRHRVT